MGGKGKKRHQNIGGQLVGKKQKQSFGKNKDDGADGSAIVLTRTKKQSSSSSYPVPGLMNLGNTCFFNSVMQNLAQTHYLQQRMKEILSLEQYPITLPSPRDPLPPLSLTVDTKPGKFAQDFHTFVQEMRDKPKQPLNPRLVFSHVCKNAPRFSSYQQQDSQELLRYLLDALRNEEINRIKRAILDNFNVKAKSSEKITISEQEKKAIKAYGMQALQSPTFVEDVFGGKIVSSVTCLECNTRYEIQEDFLDLSLPVPSETTKTGFSSRSSLKNKKRLAHHSSEDAEGDDEGEGLNSSNYKTNRNKDDPTRLSKHQLKQKRKEERKRSKGKQKYTLDQFNKETPLDQHSLDPSEHEPTTLDESPVKRSVSETTMEHHDSCLADDEVTFLSTQQDSDSSALFMQQPITDCVNQNDNKYDNQDFTAEVSPDQKDVTTNAVVPVNSVEEVVNRMEGMTLGNQNISESVVAMFEDTSIDIASVSRDNVQQSPNGTPLHSPQIKEHVQQKEITGNSVNMTRTSIDEGKREDSLVGDNNLVPKIDKRDSEITIIAVTSSLQNIEEVATANEVQEHVTEDPLLLEEDVDDIEDACKNENSTLQTGSNDSKVNQTTSVACSVKTDNKTKNTPLAKPINKFSLNYCLQQFTACELLTGSDRFCCEHCSQANQREKDASQRKENTNLNKCVKETDEMTCSKTDESTVTENVSRHDDEENSKGHLTVLVERDETSTLERSVSSTSSSNSYKEEDEDTEMLESTKESDDNMDNESHGSLSGTEGIVFRDAIKQMLIATPPPVLCLHLKRFMQQGRNFRNMRKNSCHISFPLTLDIAPYCAQVCKDFIGNGDLVLYSLYGVVVHGGGMHGGHYTAFVRVRNELQLKDIIASSTTEDKPVTNVKDKLKISNIDEEQSACTSSEKLESESVSILFDEGLDTNSENLIKIDSPRSSSPNPVKNTEPSPVKGPSDFQFDMSTVDGSWYHVSDSHVKKATESDVLRSEAYLLFYERLPSIKS